MCIERARFVIDWINCKCSWFDLNGVQRCGIMAQYQLVNPYGYLKPHDGCESANYLENVECNYCGFSFGSTASHTFSWEIITMCNYDHSNRSLNLRVEL